MELPLNSPRTKSEGFTLIELMLVMAFVAIVGGFGLFYGLENLRGASFRSERDLLIMALQRARSLAVGNTCLGSGCTDGRAHGVSIQADKFVIYEKKKDGTIDHSVDESIGANAGVIHTGATNIVFTQLSATSTGGVITLTDPAGNSTSITVGAEGQIFW